MAPTRRRRPKVAFVLGGGGNLGAYEVGMLRALLERGIRPDVVLGTSVGALNGAAVAAQPDLEMIDRLGTLWRSLADDPVYGGSWFSAAATLVRSKVALHSNAPLRELIRSTLPVRRFEELAVPFQCVAACIERAAEHWFDTGDLIPAILASTAVPGLLPPVKVGREHFMDGGLVNSIPLELQATRRLRDRPAEPVLPGLGGPAGGRRRARASHRRGEREHRSLAPEVPRRDGRRGADGGSSPRRVPVPRTARPGVARRRTPH